jgi:hypothetical protein
VNRQVRRTVARFFRRTLPSWDPRLVTETCAGGRLLLRSGEKKKKFPLTGYIVIVGVELCQSPKPSVASYFRTLSSHLLVFSDLIFLSSSVSRPYLLVLKNCWTLSSYLLLFFDLIFLSSSIFRPYLLIFYYFRTLSSYLLVCLDLIFLSSSIVGPYLLIFYYFLTLSSYLLVFSDLIFLSSSIFGPYLLIF